MIFPIKLLKKLFSTKLEKNLEAIGNTLYDDSTLAKKFEEGRYASSNLILESIADELATSLGGIARDSAFFYIQENGIRGFSMPSRESLEVLQETMYAILQKHIKVGYVCKLKQVQTKADKQIYTYYMKPSVKLQMQSTAEQLYGNVTIELSAKKSGDNWLKCTTTYYSDRSYAEVRPIEEWYGVIFLNEKFNL